MTAVESVTELLKSLKVVFDFTSFQVTNQSVRWWKLPIAVEI